MAKQNLLLVDADLRSLRVLEVSLRKAGYNVASIGNAKDALAMLEQSRPDLVLCDTRLPGMNGFELIQELRKRPELADIPLMILSSDVSVETKVRGLQLGVEDYLTKPIYIKELLARVSIVLQRKRREGIEHLEYGNKRRFSGALADMGVVDLLQAVDHNKKSGVLYLKSDGSEGAIYFCNGAPVDATVGRLHGTRAIYRTLLWTEGTFEIDFREIDREDHVQSSMQALLMEGLRRVDEWGRLLEQLPDLDTVFEVSETQLFSRLAEIPDQINAVLREFDGERSLWQIVDACDADDLETLSAVSKLYFEGLLYNTGRSAHDPKPRARTPEQPEASEVALPNISSGPPVITHTLAPAWPSVPMADGEQGRSRVDEDSFRLHIPSTPRLPEESPATPSQAPKRRKARKRKRRGASQSLVVDAATKRAAREADDADVHEVDESVAEITPSTIAPPAGDDGESMPAAAPKVASVPPPLPPSAKPSQASWPAEPTTSEVSLAELTDASEPDALFGRDAEVLSDGDVTAASRDAGMTPSPLSAVTPPPLQGPASPPPVTDAASFTLVPGSTFVRVETARPPGVETMPPLAAASSPPPGTTTLRPASMLYREESGLPPLAAERERSQSQAPVRESMAARRQKEKPATSPPRDAEQETGVSFADSPAATAETQPPLEAELPIAEGPAASATPPQPEAAANVPETAAAMDADAAMRLALAESLEDVSASAPPLDTEVADLSFAEAASHAPATTPPLDTEAPTTKPPLDADAAPDLAFAEAPANATSTTPPLDAEAAPDPSFAEAPARAPTTKPPLDAEAAPDLAFAEAPANATSTTPPVDNDAGAAPASASATSPLLDAEAAVDLSSAEALGQAPATTPPLDAETVADLSLSDSPERPVATNPPLAAARSDAPTVVDTHPPLDAESAPDLSLVESPALAAISAPPANIPAVARPSAAPRRTSGSPPPLPIDSPSQRPASGKPSPLEIAASLLPSVSARSRAPSSSAPLASKPPASTSQRPDYDAAAARLASAKKTPTGPESIPQLTSLKPSLRHQPSPPGAAATPAVTAKPPPFAAVASVSQRPSATPAPASNAPTSLRIVSANDNASQRPQEQRSEPAPDNALSAFAEFALAQNSTRPDAVPANDSEPPAEQSSASMPSAESAQDTQLEASADQQPPTAASVPASDSLSQMPTGEVVAVESEPEAQSLRAAPEPAKALSTAAPTPPKRRSTRWMQVGSVAAATALAAGLYALRTRDTAPQGSLIRAVPTQQIASPPPEQPSAEPQPAAPQTATPRSPEVPSAPQAPAARPPDVPTTPQPEVPKKEAPAADQPTASAAPEPAEPKNPPPSAASPAAEASPAKPADAKEMTAQGRSLEQKGKKKDALALYEKAVAEGGGSSELLSHMAFLYLNQGNNARAEANALKATQTDETNSEAWIVLGAARAGLGKKQAAEEAYRNCANKGKGQYVTECRRMLR